MESYLKNYLLAMLTLGLTMGSGCLTGCASMYPSLLNSPEMKKAAIVAIEQSNKTWEMEGRVSNPTIGVYYIIGVEVRVIGVDGQLGAQGAAGPQVDESKAVDN